MTAPPDRIRPIALACLLLLAGGGPAAAPLDLSQKPPVASGQEPPPNVLLTIDDSGSMSSALGGGNSTKKMDLLKNSLRAVFGNGQGNKGEVPDGRIRLAWQTLNGTVSGTGSLSAGGTNTMRSFEGAHRQAFETFVANVYPSGGTPTLAAMRRADTYARTTGQHSPWADVPGTVQDTTTKPFNTCRRMYHLLLTDGGWNTTTASDTVGATQGDSVSQTLGDGTTAYSITSDQTLVYRDNAGMNGGISTVADFAFRSWANDLQPAMANSVRPLIRKPGTETFSTDKCVTAKNCKITQEFWNPRNNPATWQHMVTYTIGFGSGAADWNRSSGVVPEPWNINNPTNDTLGGDLPRVIQGELTWPNVVSSTSYREIDMWHAAINGRGKFYPVTTATGLTAAFQEILDNVIDDTSQPTTSIAVNSGRLRAGTLAYIAGFTNQKFAGTLAARAVDKDSGEIAAADTWNAAALLDARTDTDIASRFVLSAQGFGTTPTKEASVGVAYRQLGDLTADMKAPINKDRDGANDNRGQDRIDYIRGVRSKEASKTGGVFRDRTSRLGSLVNSAVWYTARPAGVTADAGYATFAASRATRPAMLYVGANDGMLHGFDAATGVERIAYIPRGIAEGPLRQLTDPQHEHRYMVDGSPFTGDALATVGSETTAAWRTVLVGTTGAGSRGYFVLDVSAPDSAFTNANAANLVLVDRTATADRDIGHIVSPPAVDGADASRSRQIVKLNDGRWAVVMGNGVNSLNEAPVLLVQYLDGGRELVTLSPCKKPIATEPCSHKGDNGLATPRLVDLDGDDVPDVAYAGDLKGNVWKFDLGSKNTTDWKVSFAGAPLFSAKHSTVAQPITAPPYVVPHPAGGLMIVVGTGRNLTDADRTSAAVQSLYGLWDISTYTRVAGGGVTLKDASTITASQLVSQTYNATAVQDGGALYYSSSSNAVNYASVDSQGNRLVRGWTLNWPVTGQRVLESARPFAGQKILVGSMVPRSVSSGPSGICTVSTSPDRRFHSVLNVFTGAVPATSPFSVSAGVVNASALTMVEGAGGPTAIVRTDSKIKQLPSSCPPGQACAARDLLPGQTVGVRASWRQILREEPTP